MKNIRITFILFVVLSLVMPKIVNAHGSGFPPFFKIDGKIAQPYFLQNAGAFSTVLNIPQDVAGKNYLVGEEISFEIDKSKLATVYPPDTLDSITYKWDFGDAEHAGGLKQAHKYKKMGSYILTITADYQDSDLQPQIIESALINILPDKNYQLPKAVLKANKRVGTNKNYNILDFDLVNDIEFEGHESFSSSSNINKNEWDFGDDKTATGSNVVHRYELPQAFATVILRVHDTNGFFTDAYVNIRNNGKNDPDAQSNGIKINTRSYLIGGIVFLILIIVIFKKRLNRKS